MSQGQLPLTAPGNEQIIPPGPARRHLAVRHADVDAGVDRVIEAGDTEVGTLILVGAEAGLPIGEVRRAALRWDDIDLDRRMLW